MPSLSFKEGRGGNIVRLLYKHVNLSRRCQSGSGSGRLVTGWLDCSVCVTTRRLFSLPSATSFLCHSGDTRPRHVAPSTEMAFRHLPALSLSPSLSVFLSLAVAAPSFIFFRRCICLYVYNTKHRVFCFLTLGWEEAPFCARLRAFVFYARGRGRWLPETEWFKMEMRVGIWGDYMWWRFFAKSFIGNSSATKL